MDDIEKLNSKIMRRMVQVFNDGDVSTLDSWVSDKYIDHQGIGTSKMYGPEGFAEVVRIGRAAHPRRRVDIRHLIANGNTVETELFWYEIGEVRDSESGQVYQKRTFEVVRFESGRAVEHWGERIE